MLGLAFIKSITVSFCLSTWTTFLLVSVKYIIGLMCTKYNNNIYYCPFGVKHLTSLQCDNNKVIAVQWILGWWIKLFQACCSVATPHLLLFACCLHSLNLLFQNLSDLKSSHFLHSPSIIIIVCERSFFIFHNWLFFLLQLRLVWVLWKRKIGFAVSFFRIIHFLSEKFKELSNL